MSHPEPVASRSSPRGSVRSAPTRVDDQDVSPVRRGSADAALPTRGSSPTPSFPDDHELQTLLDDADGLSLPLNALAVDDHADASEEDVGEQLVLGEGTRPLVGVAGAGAGSAVYDDSASQPLPSRGPGSALAQPDGDSLQKSDYYTSLFDKPSGGVEYPWSTAAPTYSASPSGVVPSFGDSTEAVEADFRVMRRHVQAMRLELKTARVRGVLSSLEFMISGAQRSDGEVV